VLVCYDFNFEIFDEKEDLIFAFKPWLFSIGTTFVPSSFRTHQPISLITSISLNLVEHVYVFIKLVSNTTCSKWSTCRISIYITCSKWSTYWTCVCVTCSNN
jgi:hypothetical protein